MVKSLPIRSEVKIEETWNLQDLFKTEEDYNAAIAELETAVDVFAEKFEGKYPDAATVNEALQGYAAIYEQMVPIGTYTSLSSSTDQTNDEAQMRSSKYGSIAAKLNSKLSFINSELSELPVDILEEAMQQSDEFKNYLEKLIRKKDHQLHPEVEKTLAAFSSTFSASLWLVQHDKNG